MCVKLSSGGLNPDSCLPTPKKKIYTYEVIITPMIRGG